MHVVLSLRRLFSYSFAYFHTYLETLMRFFCYTLEKKDDFDWGKYLMEGEEIDLSPNADTPVSGNSFAIEKQMYSK